MSDSYSLITSLVTGFGLALPFGYFFERFLKTPALVGYICAGLAVGFFPGLPPINEGMLEQLAEIGVMLLMFGVGLHFSVRNLFAVKSLAIPGALLQMSIATILGAVFATFIWDWNIGQAVMFGLTISCASTVVVTKALELRRLTTAMHGQAAIGWLVVQDLVSVLFLVLLPPFAQVIHGAADVSAGAVALDVVKTLAGVALFVFLMLVAGRRVLPWILTQVAATGSRELFTLAVLGCAIVIAYGASAIFHVSFALSAFFAGMVMQESRYAHRAATNSLPLQDAFAVLFFVSVGLMLDWHIFLERPGEVLAVVLIIMGVTTTVSFSLSVLLRWPLDTALTVAACLGQIGEFSYILAQQGISLGLADNKMMSLIVAASIVTIALNPFLFALLPKLRHFFVLRFGWAKRAAVRTAPQESLAASTSREFIDGQTIVVGTGEPVKTLFDMLEEKRRRTIVIASANGPIEALEARGFKVIAGDAADPMVLVQAHVASAAVLVIADRNPLDARKIFNAARELNNKLPVVAALRHVEDGATFPSDDPNLHILYTDLVAAISLSVTTLRCLMAEPEAEAEEAAAEDEAELKPEERLRRLFEAEYRRSVESVRGSAASVAAPQAVRVPQTAPATPAASAEALGKAAVAAAERRRASAAAAAEAAEGAGAQTSSDAASQASRSDSGFFGRARRFFSRRGR